VGKLQFRPKLGASKLVDQSGLSKLQDEKCRCVRHLAESNIRASKPRPNGRVLFASIGGLFKFVRFWHFADIQPYELYSHPTPTVAVLNDKRMRRDYL
jgi:hypothetical protein